jgi:hypothetical protein
MNVRYEGILYSINAQDSTVQLQNVRCYGTEDRIRPDRGPPIPASQDVYDFIVFRGVDIQDLKVVVPAPVVSPPSGYPVGPALGGYPSAMIGAPHPTPYSGGAPQAPMGSLMWPGGGPAQMAPPPPPPPPYGYMEPRAHTMPLGQEHVQHGGLGYVAPPVQPGSQSNAGAPVPTLPEPFVVAADRSGRNHPQTMMSHADVHTSTDQNTETGVARAEEDAISARPSSAETSSMRQQQKQNLTDSKRSSQSDEKHQKRDKPLDGKRGEHGTGRAAANGLPAERERASSGRGRGGRTAADAMARAAAGGPRAPKEPSRNAASWGPKGSATSRKDTQAARPEPRRNDGGVRTKTAASHRPQHKPSDLEEFDFESMHQKLQKSSLIEEDLLNKIRELPKIYDKNRSFFDSLGENTANQDLTPTEPGQIANPKSRQHREGLRENAQSVHQKNIETFGEEAIRFRRHRGRIGGHARHIHVRGQGQPSIKRHAPPKSHEKEQASHQDAGKSQTGSATTA